MFNPEDLIYSGRRQGIDVFFYHGVRIDAALTDGPDGKYLYVGFGGRSVISSGEMAGLLRWFGIDRSRRFSEYEFPDRSFYLMQKKAA